MLPLRSAVLAGRFCIACGGGEISAAGHCVQLLKIELDARYLGIGFTVHDSNANFIFITHPDKSGQVLQHGLRDRGVLVRWFNKSRIDQYLRVSIGTDADMEQMCAACEDILKG